MKIKFKLIFKLCSRRVILWNILAALFCLICYALFSLKRVSVEPTHERYIMFDENYEVRNPKVGLQELLWRVERSISEAGKNILNADDFTYLNEKMPVIVVLAGRSPSRLQWLLASLAEVTDIGDVLLVISYSFIDDAIEELVGKVNYCRVLRLYYPYSVQLFPSRFPGSDANRSMDSALKAEQKQHWWWTAHFLFNHYHWINSKLEIVIFLQEDDVVAPDLLHMLTYAKRAFQYHPEAEVITLGSPVNEAGCGLLTEAPWQPRFGGIAFNRSFWQKLQASASYFCLYNDASWSHSLLAAFSLSPRGYVDMIGSLSPRVLSTRVYGSAREGAKAARALFYKCLFPMRVRVGFLANDAGRVVHPQSVPPGAGGWEDVRDRLLCVDPFLMTTPTHDNSTAQRKNLKLPGT